MAYSAIKQGTFYPLGGLNQVIIGLIKLCKDLGVEFIANEEVVKINIKNKKVTSITTNSGGLITSDFVIASADYAHVEKDLIDSKYKNYSQKYWEKRDLRILRSAE